MGEIIRNPGIREPGQNPQSPLIRKLKVSKKHTEEVKIFGTGSINGTCVPETVEVSSKSVDSPTPLLVGATGAEVDVLPLLVEVEVDGSSADVTADTDTDAEVAGLPLE